MENSIINCVMSGPCGNIASVLGIFLSIIGFAITFWQVWKSKNAAQAAEQAVQKVREDVRKIDTVSELSAAISIMDEVKRLHREAAWIIVRDRYPALRKSLISIRSANPNLPEEYKVTIQSAIQHFSNIERKIDQSLDRKENPANVPKLNGRCTPKVGLI